jgi:hypothetical protein
LIVRRRDRIEAEYRYDENRHLLQTERTGSPIENSSVHRLDPALTELTAMIQEKA